MKENLIGSEFYIPKDECNKYFLSPKAGYPILSDIYYLNGGRFKSRVSNKIINLEAFYDECLVGLDSQISKNFRSAIEIQKVSEKVPEMLEFEREFPIYILNRPLWWKLLSKHGVNTQEYRDRHVFMLDYFFYKTGLVVEIDGSCYHSKREGYDKARDEYLREVYRLKTIRLVDFSAKDIADIIARVDFREFIRLSRSIIKNRPGGIEMNFYLGYEKYIYGNPINDLEVYNYQSIYFEVIDLLEKIIPDYYEADPLVIKKEHLDRVNKIITFENNPETRLRLKQVYNLYFNRDITYSADTINQN